MSDRNTQGFVKYSLDEFSKMCQRSTGYDVLKRTIGTAKTTAIMLAVHERNHRVPNALVATFPNTINDIFVQEADRIRNKRSYVLRLLDEAQKGRLRHRLTGKTEPVANYSNVSGGGADGTPGGDVRNRGLAYDWIAKSWRGEGRDSIMAALIHYGKDAADGPPLGYDVSIAEDLFQRVVKTNHPFRAPNPIKEIKYPSSFGGKYLLEQMFLHTAGVAWPAQGNEQWDDYALFYLAGIVTVQGFVDGNKRVGKLAYAITFLKGGRPFRAPTIALENELYSMN